MADEPQGNEPPKVTEAKEDIELVRDLWRDKPAPPPPPPPPPAPISAESIPADPNPDPDRPRETLEQDQQGCARMLGVPLGIAVIVVSAVIALVFFTRDTGSDDSTTSAASGGDSAQSSTGNVTGIAAYAGTWTYASGLDDPTGLDEWAQHSDPIDLGPRSGSFEITEDGMIGNGRWHSENVTHTPACDEKHTLDGSFAEGAVREDGTGKVIFTSTPKVERPSEGCGESGASQRLTFPVLTFSIDGDTMYVCRAHTGDVACSAANANGTFKRS